MRGTRAAAPDSGVEETSMWGKRTARVGAFLDETSEIEGRYTCSGTVVLDAKVRGEITARDTLVVGEHGLVDGTVSAGTLVVHGTLIGNVTATESVELKHGARVTGDIQSPVIAMEPGAVHDGRCRMTKDTPAEAPVSAVVIPLKG